ncbi:MAG: MBL fold metallo-hydrolase [Bacteroidota bacterium]
MCLRIVLVLTASLILLQYQQQLAQPNPHFHLEQLKTGVYAAVAEKGGHAICNAGIIDLGDATIVIDPFMGLDAAKALSDSATRLTGRKVTHVVNTHYHDDHVLGNQIFEGAQFISTQQTRELMLEILPTELIDAQENAKKRLAELANADTTTMSRFEYEEHLMWRGYYSTFINNSDSVKLTLPDVTFHDQMTIKGKNRSLVLKSLGAGHTGSDLIVFMPQDSIAFAGDLLFVGHHPWLGDGNPDEWINCLESLKMSSVNLIVPGHGPLGSKNDLDTLEEYIRNALEKVDSYVKKKKTPFEDPELMIPEKYSEWHLSIFYKPNIYSLFRKKEAR